MQRLGALADQLDMIDMRRVADHKLQRRVDLVIGLATPSWLSISMTRAPCSTTMSERAKTAAAVSGPMKTR
jgi:hypothetical protein